MVLLHHPFFPRKTLCCTRNVSEAEDKKAGRKRRPLSIVHLALSCNAAAGPHDKLIGLYKGLMADGVINTDEAVFLRELRLRLPYIAKGGRSRLYQRNTLKEIPLVALTPDRRK